MIFLPYFRLAVFLLLPFFLGFMPVKASSEGISDTIHYQETDKKTNYIKIELQDGNLMLSQIASSNSSLVGNTPCTSMTFLLPAFV